ncbi:lycopene beta-cyclase [Ranunculus cassubicifolius]
MRTCSRCSKQLSKESPHYWHGFLSSRLFLPELFFFGLSLFSHASNASRLEIMAKGTLPLVNMMNNLIKDSD